MKADDHLNVPTGLLRHDAQAARQRMGLAWLAAGGLHGLALCALPWPAPAVQTPATPLVLEARLRAAPPAAIGQSADPEPPARPQRGTRPARPRIALPSEQPDAAPLTAPAEAVISVPTGAATESRPHPGTPDMSATATAQAKAGGSSSTGAAAGTDIPRSLRQRCPQQSEPAFPRRALRSGLASGRVELRLHLKADGSVGQAETLSAEPDGVFETAAIAAAMQWRCLPAAEAGSTVRVSFVFRAD